MDERKLIWNIKGWSEMKIKYRCHNMALLWKTILGRVIQPRVGCGPLGLKTPLKTTSFEQPFEGCSSDRQNAPLQTNHMVSGKRRPEQLTCWDISQARRGYHCVILFLLCGFSKRLVLLLLYSYFSFLFFNFFFLTPSPSTPTVFILPFSCIIFY